MTPGWAGQATSGDRTGRCVGEIAGAVVDKHIWGAESGRMSEVSNFGMRGANALKIATEASQSEKSLRKQ